MTVRAIAAARRIDTARVAEVQGVREVIVRRSRTIEAAVADKAETAIEVAAITRSRVPDGGSPAELAGEVHAFVGAII